MLKKVFSSSLSAFPMLGVGVLSSPVVMFAEVPFSSGVLKEAVVFPFGRQAPVSYVESTNGVFIVCL